jgi:uncharacterized protein (DUF488 family)
MFDLLWDDPTAIFTIGHSSRPLREFLQLLQAHELLIDVRKAPGSRNYPQFNHHTLEQALAEIGVGYLHMPQLGGLRASRDSPNAGWRNRSFQGIERTLH